MDWRLHWQTQELVSVGPWVLSVFVLIYSPVSFLRRDPGTMPRSPTSSEDEMAQSFSDYSVGSESDSSKEETIYDTIRATTEKPSGPKMEEIQGNTLVIRVLIQDLQQTVSPCVRQHARSRSTWMSVSRGLSGGCGELWSTLGLQVGVLDPCSCVALTCFSSLAPLLPSHCSPQYSLSTLIPPALLE